MSKFVLVACEESQVVCSAFRAAGFIAFSCDLKPCSGGHPEWHILSDVLPLLNGFCSFHTMSGDFYSLNSKWDLIIAHPPCTFLCRASAVRLFPNGELSVDRFKKGLAAKDFFLTILSSDCDFICVENPTPLNIFNLPPCSCVVEPYYFGHNYSKRTCLWLKGLPPLFSSCLVVPEFDTMSFFSSNGTSRSKTPFGLAAAMVSQWSYLFQTADTVKC